MTTTTNELATPAMATDCLLDVRQVAAKLRLSTRQVWKLASDGRLPKPLKLARSARGRESDVSKFIVAGCRMSADR